MKTKRIIDISVIGREVEFKSDELFAIYTLIANLEGIKYNNSDLNDFDKKIITKAIGLLSNIIDKNTIDKLLYNPCSDIFEFTQISPEDPATILDKAIH
jgi:hypothetical protein